MDNCKLKGRPMYVDWSEDRTKTTTMTTSANSRYIQISHYYKTIKGVGWIDNYPDINDNCMKLV